MRNVYMGLPIIKKLITTKKKPLKLSEYLLRSHMTKGISRIFYYFQSLSLHVNYFNFTDEQ